MKQPFTFVEKGKFDFVIDAEIDGKEYVIDIKETETIKIADESTCYASGTLIRTVRGDVAVEALAIGDHVVTASGEHRPIRWLGHRTVDCRRHPNPDAVLPIRIAADAFGPGRPERDLLVSPGHSLCITVFDEVLIPASALVNGATIDRANVDEVTYWHVELDSHDILLANGLAAESFNDVGNRPFFVESATVDVTMLPDAIAAAKEATCRPFFDGGPVVAIVRDRMRTRAQTLGWSTSAAALGGLHVVADGVRIEAQESGLRARFLISATATEVRLVSDTSIPRGIGCNDDPRLLGVCLGTVTVSDGFDVRRSLDLTTCRIEDGFHPAQEGHRWTRGDASLPTSLWADCQGMFFLSLELAAVSPPRWVAPEQPAAVERLRASA